MEKFVLQVLALGALALNIICQPDAPIPNIDLPTNNTSLFNIYIKFNNKVYNNMDEYRYRAHAFFDNLQKMIGARNISLKNIISVQSPGMGPILKLKQPDSACDFEMSLNQFFDLSKEEFENYYLLPPKFFDKKKYKPISKIVDIDNGKTVVTEIKDDVDPLDEVLKNDQNGTVTANEGLLDFKRLFGLSKKENSKKKAIEELRQLLHNMRSRVDLSKGSNPEGDGLTPSCRRVLNIMDSILNGVSKLGVSYSQTPSNLDFSELFTERKLQSSLTVPAKYLQQRFPKYTTIEGIKVPTYLNWNNISKLTPVKNQKKCNACYIFSANGAIESHSGIVNDDRRILAEQEILDCSSENEGCIGGQPFLVFDYIIKNGIAYDDYYPYKSKKETCKAQHLNYTMKFNNLKGYIFVKEGVVNLIKALQYGPVAIVMYASEHLKYYYNGIFEGQGCTGNEVPNHSALLYGYNLESKKPYFLLKNGWGDNWGDNGHYRMSIGPLNNNNKGYCLIAETSYNVLPVLRR